MRGAEPKRHVGIWRALEQYASSDAPLAESERIDPNPSTTQSVVV
jgi:hypothetical protein